MIACGICGIPHSLLIWAVPAVFWGIRRVPAAIGMAWQLCIDIARRNGLV